MEASAKQLRREVLGNPTVISVLGIRSATLCSCCLGATVLPSSQVFRSGVEGMEVWLCQKLPHPRCQPLYRFTSLYLTRACCERSQVLRGKRQTFSLCVAVHQAV